MTLTETALDFAVLARTKTKALRTNPLGFWIAAMMAGAYIGIGILLIFGVGENVDPSVRSLVMGCSFGIALTLVIFAGSELFTGHAMFMTLGLLAGATSLGDLGRSWGRDVVRKLDRMHRAERVVCGRRRWRHPWGRRRPAPCRRHQENDGLGQRTGRPRNVVQLAGLSGDLDFSKNRQRRGEMHPDLLVPVRLYRLGVRAQHRQYDDLFRCSTVGPS